MYPALSQVERAELVTRYQRLPDDQAVYILDSPQVVAEGNGQPLSFKLDELVEFTWPDTTHANRLRTMTGRIGLFVRRRDPFDGQGISAVVIDEQHHFRRVPLTALSKTNP